MLEDLRVSRITSLSLTVTIQGADLPSLEPWQRLDAILAGSKFEVLQNLNVTFDIRQFEGPIGEAVGRVPLDEVLFELVAQRSVEVRICRNLLDLRHVAPRMAPRRRWIGMGRQVETGNEH